MNQEKDKETCPDIWKGQLVVFKLREKKWKNRVTVDAETHSGKNKDFNNSCQGYKAALP